MKQNKTESIIETIADVGSGFIFSMVIWAYIAAPLLGIEHKLEQNILVTVIFTISSIARKYCWRRFFANKIHVKLHSFLRDLKMKN